MEPRDALHYEEMSLLALLAVLSVPASASVALRWAPALGQALPSVSGGPATDVARGFDGPALNGLEIRLNELDILSSEGVDDLDGVRRLRRQGGGASAVAADRLLALERSLTIFAPVIARLEVQGVRMDGKGNATTALGPALSRALTAVAAASDRRARALASRYGTERSLERELADSQEVDALLRDRYPFISIAALDRLARVHDSGRTRLLAERRAAQSAQFAFVAPEERAVMRDAVAAPPRSLVQRLKARARALAARIFVH